MHTLLTCVRNLTTILTIWVVVIGCAGNVANNGNSNNAVIPVKANYRLTESINSDATFKYIYGSDGLMKIEVYRGGKVDINAVCSYSGNQLTSFKAVFTNGDLAFHQDYLYDSKGRMYQYIMYYSPYKQTNVLTFDDKNRPIKETRTYSNLKPVEEITYEYDGNDNVIKWSYVDGSQTATYTYDDKQNYLKPSNIPFDITKLSTNNVVSATFVEHSGGKTQNYIYKYKLTYDSEGKVVQSDDYFNDKLEQTTFHKYEKY